ncbi:Arf-GAP with dual PH domain-containing protein 1 [Takifugu flavidus]|uniref:Arf-GAP with dual PH domain-containing protein 1 n=1 Tax=Takifugu flavidus TaxID=433684 RepID=A0A5C6MVM9_9TELE|nr:Arf-GAP with dual PH domain-containing protein 1 [Takifugu flavidus]
MSLNASAARTLREIQQIPGNEVCADCGALVEFVLFNFLSEDPGWGSCSLGVFICLDCSGIHRNIPAISKVKSLNLSHWEDHELQLMAENGNQMAKSKYEAAVPVYYYKPTHKDCRLLREQWIRAKYERKEFTEPAKSFTYDEETRDGMLMKRGRDNGQFLSRRFVLSEREGTLKYFTKYDAKEPKAIIKIDGMNATFQPEKIGNPNGLQITYLKDYSTRSIFVYHDSGKEIVDWFNSIRAVQLRYLQVAFPGATDTEQTEGFKKRWFTLDHRRLMYYKDPLLIILFYLDEERLKPYQRDAFAKGEVFLGNKDHGYSVSAGLPAGTYRNGAWQHGITIKTPDRCYLFTCELESDQQDWLKHFSDVMSAQMSPQEYTMEALFKHRA